VTQSISNSQRIRADSAQMEWSKLVQASAVQVQKNWGLVRSGSKNYSDWIGLDMDGPSPDWSIAGLVESLLCLVVIHLACLLEAFSLVG